MGRRHGKGAAVRPFETYVEHRAKASRAVQLGGEAVKQPDDCVLCLQGARAPHACPAGHVFCHQCILGYCLTRRKEIRAAKESEEVS
jgi:nitric oxide synthase-interacting protein